jgi:hypothetical protein
MEGMDRRTNTERPGGETPGRCNRWWIFPARAIVEAGGHNRREETTMTDDLAALRRDLNAYFEAAEVNNQAMFVLQRELFDLMPREAARKLRDRLETHAAEIAAQHPSSGIPVALLEITSRFPRDLGAD